MDTDNVKMYGARVRVDSMTKVGEIEAAEKEKRKQKMQKRPLQINRGDHGLKLTRYDSNASWVHQNHVGKRTRASAMG